MGVCEILGEICVDGGGIWLFWDCVCNVFSARGPAMKVAPVDL